MAMGKPACGYCSVSWPRSRNSLRRSVPFSPYLLLCPYCSMYICLLLLYHVVLIRGSRIPPCNNINAQPLFRDFVQPALLFPVDVMYIRQERQHYATNKISACCLTRP